MPVKTVTILVQAMTDRANAQVRATSAVFDELRAKSPVEMQVKFDKAQALAESRIMAREMSATVREVVKLQTEGDGGGLIARLMRGGSGAGQGLPGVLGNIPGAGGLSPVAAIAAVAAGLAALPFLAQAAAGGITLALGGGLAALGVAGALGTGKTVTPGQVTAAQDALKAAQLRQIAAQDRLNQLMASGKTTAGQLASAQAAVASSSGSIATAQDRLNKLLSNAQDPTQLAMRKAFTSLSNDAQTSLAQIGKSFQPVMLSIFNTADSVLLKMTPVFAAAVKVISGPVELIANTLIKSLASPQVVTMIKELATAFGALLTAFAPAIPGIVTSIADGFTNLFRAVAKNPKAFADMAVGVFHLIGILLDVLAWLTQIAAYLEMHFIPAWQRTLKFLEQWRHDIVAMFAGLWHDTTTWFDRIRHDVAAAWNLTWNDTIGALTRAIARIEGALGNWVSNMFGIGKAAVTMLWNGAKSLWNSITGFFSDLGGSILKAIKGILGIHSPSSAFFSVGVNIMQGLLAGLKSESGHLLSWMGNLASSALGKISGFSPGTGLSSSANSNMVLMQQMAKARGWFGDQWTALFNVEMAEAGFSMTAKNPNSGAYGMAQFINGPSEYYLYGGNPWTAAGQITGMLNYIASRYGNPGAAWAHEQAFHWYDQGGMLPPGLSLALNTTGKAEVIAGSGMGRVETLLGQLVSLADELCSLQAQGNAIGAAAPAVTGAAMGGGGSAAAYKVLYP